MSRKTVAVDTSTFLEVLRNTANIIGLESRRSDPNSNRILPEYKPEASSRVLTCSLKFGTGDRGLCLKPVNTFSNFKPQWPDIVLSYNKFISNFRILKNSSLHKTTVRMT